MVIASPTGEFTLKESVSTSLSCNNCQVENTKQQREKVNDRGIMHWAKCSQSESAVLASLIALKHPYWTCPECLRVISIDPFDPVLNQIK